MASNEQHVSPQGRPPRPATELEQAYVDWLFGFRTEPEVVRWAVRTVCSDGPLSREQRLIDLASLDPAKQTELADTGRRLGELVEDLAPHFDLQSNRIVRYVREMFRKQCQAYNRRERTPYQMRRYVDGIKERYGEPVWLGEFLRNLDGVTEETKRYEVPYLTPYIEKYLKDPRFKVPPPPPPPPPVPEE